MHHDDVIRDFSQNLVDSVTAGFELASRNEIIAVKDF